jgi:hypothetical protein
MTMASAHHTGTTVTTHKLKPYSTLKYLKALATIERVHQKFEGSEESFNYLKALGDIERLG